MKQAAMTEDHKYLGMAVELAKDNVVVGGGPFGAVIVMGGELIATGVNRVTRQNDPTAHAEILAIREAAKITGSPDLEGCVLYSSCEPCPMCLGAVYWAGIRKLVFASSREDAENAGFLDAQIYREFEANPEFRSIKTSKIDLPGAGEEFTAWINHAGRVEY